MGSLYHRGGLADFSADQLRYLRFGRCLDTTRMRTELGFRPQYSTRAAFQDFVRTRGLRGPLSPQVINALERRLVAQLRPGPADRPEAVR
jgi:UDP-glucose 4-epimerase